MPPLDSEAAAPTTGTAAQSAYQHSTAHSPILAAAGDNRRDELVGLANTLVVCHAGGLITVTAATRPAVMLAYALIYAMNGWEVFPLGAKKAPRIKSPHPKGSRCKGECGRDGHGLHDATSDIATICRWWGVEYRCANIGARVQAGLFVLDLDPRKPGHAAAMTKLITDHGLLPHTLTTLSGRLDGGRHLFYRQPPGKLSIAELGPEFAVVAEPGIDIKGRGGLVVLPPSIHHATGKSYIAVDAAVADLPASLVKKLVVVPQMTRSPLKGGSAASAASTAPGSFWAGAGRSVKFGDSVADWFTDNHTWHHVLEPRGWVCRDADGDADGARWLHPTHTSDVSATVSNGCLFVYSTSTEFEPTGAGDTHGYTKFRAYAVLNFGGDLKAAARYLREAA